MSAVMCDMPRNRIPLSLCRKMQVSWLIAF